MPIYNIRCTNTYCGKEDEIRCYHSDIQKTICSECWSKVTIVPASANFTINGFKSKKGVLTKNYE